MHHRDPHTAQRQAPPAPSGLTVRDSSFGAFADALPAPAAARTTPGQRLCAHVKAACTVDGYTSYPAYAERLERLVEGLMTPDARGRL
jgi:hypothetical protein